MKIIHEGIRCVNYDSLVEGYYSVIVMEDLRGVEGYNSLRILQSYNFVKTSTNITYENYEEMLKEYNESGYTSGMLNWWDEVINNWYEGECIVTLVNLN